MRTTSILTSLLGAAALVAFAAPAAHADPDQGTLRVVATTGADHLPVAGAQFGITTCRAGSVLATLTTGGDGTATRDFPPDCYMAEITKTPSGCSLASMAYLQIEVTPAATATLPFEFHCA
ncbi:hypothetical protein D5S18_28405 [Nocardia panacis]|uniref:Uncharacterized protein n=1 Tax=Nocardia panacis TaxID=2340916 RepID=A0A3A4K8Z7_9NOCA|nr:prealbumin-like fold domain-containing protein [Nocardia panacis]RJO69824.1 hypothetical protein D5S18_28405 [Nocardia panacis]